MKQKKIVPYPLFDSDSPLLSDHANELDIFLDKPFWIWIKTNARVERCVKCKIQVLNSVITCVCLKSYLLLQKVIN